MTGWVVSIIRFLYLADQILCDTNSSILMPATHKKKLIFFLTNLAYQALVGQIGVYSIIKAPMSQLFDYDQQFLGAIQTVQMIGELFGSFFILFTTVNSAKGHLLMAFANCVTGALFFAPRFILSIIPRDIMLMVCFFSQFFTMASLAFPQVIFSNNFDQNSKKCQYSVWYSLTFVGDISAFGFAQLAIYSFGLSWELTKFIWSLYILGTALLMYKYIDHSTQAESEIQQIILANQSEDDIDEINQQSKDSVLSQQHQNQLIPKSKALNNYQACLILTRKILKILKEPRLLLLVLSFGFIQTLFCNLVFWIPYYYVTIDQPNYSTMAIVLSSVANVTGGLTIQIFLFQALKLEKYSKQITYILTILSTAAYVALWINRQNQPIVQIVLLLVGNFCLAVPYSRVSATDPIDQCGEDQSKMKTVILLGHFGRNLITAVFTLIIGIFMKIDSGNFWHAILANLVIIFVLETIRKVIFSSTNLQLKDQSNVESEAQNQQTTN